MSDDKTAYQRAGVDVEAGYEAVRRYESVIASTRTAGVLGGIGGFAGMFSLRDAGVSLDDPILVSATDGVGTKLKLAFALDRHETIGIDCVAMCVNDIAVTGAKPLFFLDYVATGRLDPRQAAAVVEGIAAGCVQAGCALVGGETAEMPGFYAPREYDVAGFAVGVVDRSAILDRAAVREGDVLVGLASTGFHSNGYSLVRAILDETSEPLDQSLGERTLGEALLAPTRIYVEALEAIRGAGVDLHAAAHVTGGGFVENLPRALPDGLGYEVDVTAWPVPDVVRHVCDLGAIERSERYGVFNMGVGMVLAVDPRSAGAAIAASQASGVPAWEIGEVIAGESRLLGLGG